MLPKRIRNAASIFSKIMSRFGDPFWSVVDVSFSSPLTFSEPDLTSISLPTCLLQMASAQGVRRWRFASATDLGNNVGICFATFSRMTEKH